MHNAKTWTARASSENLHIFPVPPSHFTEAWISECVINGQSALFPVQTVCHKITVQVCVQTQSGLFCGRQAAYSSVRCFSLHEQGYWGISSCHYYTGQHCFPMSDSSICMWERVRHWERVSVGWQSKSLLCTHIEACVRVPSYMTDVPGKHCVKQSEWPFLSTWTEKRHHDKNKSSSETENPHLTCINNVTSCLHRKYWISYTSRLTGSCLVSQCQPLSTSSSCPWPSFPSC